MQQLIRALYDAAVEAVEPRRAVARCLCRHADTLSVGGRDYHLERYEQIRVVGCGKAGAPMTAAVVAVLGDHIGEGCVTVKYGHGSGFHDERIALVEAGHPRPDAAGLDGAGQAHAMLSRAGEHDLVVALISGGGSALWPLPAEGLTLEEKSIATDLLLGCGADIIEVNCVRKHLSALKGGQAARVAAPAEVVVLVLSDVIGDPLEAIASGPFHPDSSTFGQALDIVRAAGIEQRLPDAVRARLQRGAAGAFAETPKADEACVARVQHTICAGNACALDAAAKAAERHGLQARVLTSALQGDVAEAADFLMEQVRGVREQGGVGPVCLLSGGETTVTLADNHGRGGRNQQLALEMARRIDGLEGITVLSCGTDGTDGPTDAAGGIVTGATAHTARERGLDLEDALRRNDAYPLLDSLGALVRTGPTGTNVMDVQVVVVG